MMDDHSPTSRANMPEIAEDPRDRTSLSDAEFKKQLGEVIPHLRAFGRSLSGNRDVADDLVQETLLKAWAARERFQAGTNMRAWTFIILRNYYLSQMRRRSEEQTYELQYLMRISFAVFCLKKKN